MTLLANVLERLGELYIDAYQRAVRVAEALLAPAGPVPRKVVARLLGRALRNGAWRGLSNETRAFLLAAARAPLKVYRAPLLLALIRRAWVLVELATTRGRAVVAALMHLIARGAAQRPYSLLRIGMGRLIAIGIQVLNSPWLQRIIPAM